MVRNIVREHDLSAHSGKGRPKTLNRQHVLDVAMQALWASEAADVSVNALCGLAGVSKPSVYREFGSEDGLTCAVLAQYMERMMPRINTIFSAGKSLDASLEQLIHFVCYDAFTSTGCLFVKLNAKATTLGAQTLSLTQQIKAGALSAVAAFLQTHAHSGHWLAQHPAPVAANYVFSQMGLGLSMRAAGVPEKEIAHVLKMGFRL